MQDEFVLKYYPEHNCWYYELKNMQKLTKYTVSITGQEDYSFFI